MLLPTLPPVRDCLTQHGLRQSPLEGEEAVQAGAEPAPLIDDGLCTTFGDQPNATRVADAREGLEVV